MHSVCQHECKENAHNRNTANAFQATMEQPSRTIVRAKLEMTNPDSQEEVEADAAANDIVQGGKVARSMFAGSAGGGIGVSAQMESQLNALQGRGQQMPPALRCMMERGFGRDFSQVRLHTDSTAADMSASIHAKAFAHGSDIYFNRGQYNPNTTEGQRLVAHELAHVAQENGKIGRKPGDVYLFETDGSKPSNIISLFDYYYKSYSHVGIEDIEGNLFTAVGKGVEIEPLNKALAERNGLILRLKDEKLDLGKMQEYITKPRSTLGRQYVIGGVCSSNTRNAINAGRDENIDMACDQSPIMCHIPHPANFLNSKDFKVVGRFKNGIKKLDGESERKEDIQERYESCKRKLGRIEAIWDTHLIHQKETPVITSLVEWGFPTEDEYNEAQKIMESLNLTVSKIKQGDKSQIPLFDEQADRINELDIKFRAKAAEALGNAMFATLQEDDDGIVFIKNLILFKNLIATCLTFRNINGILNGLLNKTIVNVSLAYKVGKGIDIGMWVLSCGMDIKTAIDKWNSSNAERIYYSIRALMKLAACPIAPWPPTVKALLLTFNTASGIGDLYGSYDGDIVHPRRRAEMVADFYGGPDSVGGVLGYVAGSIPVIGEAGEWLGKGVAAAWLALTED